MLVLLLLPAAAFAAALPAPCLHQVALVLPPAPAAATVEIHREMAGVRMALAAPMQEPHPPQTTLAIFMKQSRVAVEIIYGAPPQKGRCMRTTPTTH